MSARVDIKGEIFGRWTVLEREPSKGRNSYWLCECTCGVQRAVMTQSLRNGSSLSCGCYNREVNAANPNGRTHGCRKTAEYSVFSGIKRRCNNPNEKCFPRYGGRGIKCLYEGFDQFLTDVGKRPSPKHQIDRIDTNGHYAPGNCRWVLPKQQQRNRRDTVMVSVGDRLVPLPEACEIYGQPYKRVWQRINRDGWSAERALGASK
jgi:hypothetical protein